MSATTADLTMATAARLSGYSAVARLAARSARPAWFVATFDVVAVLLAFGAVNAINGMIFRVPTPSEVLANEESKQNRLAISSDVERIGEPLPALAGLAREARIALATPDELILFAEPSVFEGRFGDEPNVPGSGAFAGTGGSQSASDSEAGGAPPATETPTDNLPSLLAYLPVPERAAGAPIDLTGALRLDVGASANSSGTQSRAGLSTEAAGAIGGSVGQTVEATAGATASVSATASSSLSGVSSSVGTAAGAAVGSVASLLR